MKRLDLLVDQNHNRSAIPSSLSFSRFGLLFLQSSNRCDSFVVAKCTRTNAAVCLVLIGATLAMTALAKWEGKSLMVTVSGAIV
jgi:uncharacterized membrane protein YidH (DUF202 family)